MVSTASIVGPKEGDGPLKDYYDVILEDDLWGKNPLKRQKPNPGGGNKASYSKCGSITKSDRIFVFRGFIKPDNIFWLCS